MLRALNISKFLSSSVFVGEQKSAGNCYDHAGRLLRTYHEVAETIQWVQRNNTTVNGNTIEKTSGTDYVWDAGAESSNILPAGRDGWIEMTTDRNNRSLFFGLSEYSADDNWNTIENAFYLTGGGQVQIRRAPSGTNFLGYARSYAAGDKFRIERKDTDLHFYHNGELIHTRSGVANTNLKVDISFYQLGSRITDAKMGFGKVLLSEYHYNELGELIEKNLHSENESANFSQSVDYRYNIRGWLQSINNAALSETEANAPGDYFGLEMGYNNDLGIGNTPRYNGDVSGIKWSTDLGLPDISQRANTYEYDVMSRLKSANHKYQISSVWQPSVAHSVSNIAYDLQGNVTEIIRKDELGANLDHLSYVYNGNQPVNITDAGDIGYGFKDGNVHTTTGIDDYDFDENGNLSKDENKDIISYSYNYLNLPEKIELTEGREIRFIYDAAGIKLAQENYENGELVKRRDYIGEFFYENDTLQFISHDEGRIVKDADDSYVYEYTISDRLENNWLSFTTRTDKWEFTATMEPEEAINEEVLFSNVAETREGFVSANHTAGGMAVALLDSARRVGPSISLHVFPGDTVSVEAYAYFEGGSGYSGITSLATLVEAVAGSFGGVNGGNEVQQVTYDAFDNAFGIMGMGGTDDDYVPAAYLNYILFDKQMNYKRSGFIQMSSAANMNHERLAFDNMLIDQEGFIYIYCSYESQLGRAFFDDMKVTYAEGPLVSGNTYFPNGGRIEALSFQRPISPVNRFGFINRELVDDYGVELYDHLARYLDPWWGPGYTGIDPLADKFSSWTPYQYAFRNPMRFIDKTGMAPEEGNGGGPCGDKPCPEESKTETTGSAQGSHVESTETGERFHGYKMEGKVSGEYGEIGGKVSGFSGGYEGSTESGGAHGKTSVYAVDGEANVRVGILSVEGEGSILKAELNGDAGIYTGDEGKYGAELSGDAGAYVAEGEVTPSISLLGIKIGVTYGGSWGSAHAGGRAAATYDGNTKEGELTLMGHLGLGVGLKLGFTISNTDQEINKKKP